jgi:hypothetical protein
MKNILAKFINFCTVHNRLILIFAAGAAVGNINGNSFALPFILLVLILAPSIPGFIAFARRLRLAYRGEL